MEHIDPYAVLGVSKDAEDVEIKRAFRKRILQCHSDRFPGDKNKAAEFRAVSDAYEMIDTAEKRRQLKQSSGASFRHGAGGAHTSFYRRVFRVGEEE